MGICNEEEFKQRREIREIKKSGGICPECALNGDNCPNPNWYEGRATIACVWHEPKVGKEINNENQKDYLSKQKRF